MVKGKGGEKEYDLFSFCSSCIILSPRDDFCSD